MKSEEISPLDWNLADQLDGYEPIWPLGCVNNQSNTDKSEQSLDTLCHLIERSKACKYHQKWAGYIYIYSFCQHAFVVDVASVLIGTIELNFGPVSAAQCQRRSTVSIHF